MKIEKKKVNDAAAAVLEAVGENPETECEADSGDEIRHKKVHRDLKHEFTESELLEIGRESARAVQKINMLQAQKKTFNDEIKARISENEAVLRDSSRLIRNGYELRDTECEEITNFMQGTLTVIRMDTGEIEIERPLEEWERQMEIQAATDEEESDDGEKDEPKEGAEETSETERGEHE